MSGEASFRGEKEKTVEVRDKNWAIARFGDFFEAEFPELMILYPEKFMDSVLPSIFGSEKESVQIGLTAAVFIDEFGKSHVTLSKIDLEKMRSFVTMVKADAELRSYFEREKGDEAEKKEKRDKAVIKLLASFYGDSWAIRQIIQEDRIRNLLPGTETAIMKYLKELINVATKEELLEILKRARSERPRRKEEADAVIALFNE